MLLISGVAPPIMILLGLESGVVVLELLSPQPKRPREKITAVDNTIFFLEREENISNLFYFRHYITNIFIYPIFFNCKKYKNRIESKV